MLINCPTHGETEGYDHVVWHGRCILCRRATLPKREPKTHARETVPILSADPWLTCNQPGCGTICADVHQLFVHKRSQHSTTPFDPEQPFEPRSLLPSSLGQV